MIRFLYWFYWDCIRLLVCRMSTPAAVCWCFYLSLLLIDARSVGQHDESSSHIRLEPPRTRDHALLLPRPVDAEVLDLDHRRIARGAEEEEPQSTFSHSYENDSVTPPKVTEFDNVTKAESEGGDKDESDKSEDNNHHGNASSPEHRTPTLFNPFYPMAESSYAAYAILFLAGLVLAVGVVGNMAVMCVVWNNYYMRSAWNYLLASMAFWDFLVLVLCLPVVVLNQLSHRRILGDITCRMVPYMEVGVALVGGLSATTWNHTVYRIFTLKTNNLQRTFGDLDETE